MRPANRPGPARSHGGRRRHVRPARWPRRFALGLVLLSARATAAVTVAPSPASPLDLNAARLGLSLDAWKALPFPGPPASRVAPACAAGPDGTVICGYVSRYGRYTLPATLALGPRFQARGFRFTFRDGRLSSIEYRTSANAYNDVTARLIKRYGPAAQRIGDDVDTEVGKLPRVRQIWHTPRGGSIWSTRLDPSRT